MLWLDILNTLKVNIDCYHVSVIPYTVCPEEGSPTLKDVMVFLTGCDSVPPLGWDCPASIEFTDDVGLPEISTCTT